MSEKKETYSSNVGPICPYCGHENASQGNDYWAEEQGSGEDRCDNCDNVYKFSVDFTTHYYAEEA